VDNPTPVIINAPKDDNRRSELCIAVVELFVNVVSAEAGNLALKFLARGGVYLSGGIIPYMIPLLKNNFMNRFTEKGRFTTLMRNFPVLIITHPQPALYGAARVGFSMFGNL
jgi:glucokinase